MTWDVLTLLFVATCGIVALAWISVNKGLRYTLGLVFRGVAGYGQYAAGRAVSMYDQRPVSVEKPPKSTTGLVIDAAFDFAGDIWERFDNHGASPELDEPDYERRQVGAVTWEDHYDETITRFRH